MHERWFCSSYFFLYLQEQTLALRKEGIGVVLDSELPHLIGIDDDLLSTGIILYHLKVIQWTAVIAVLICCLKKRSIQYIFAVMWHSLANALRLNPLE